MPEAPRFITEPAAVLREIIAAAEPGLAPAVTDEAIRQVTAHRPRLRELARALHDDPDLLISGRPAGPASVAKLIQALRDRGAVRVMLPRCAHCGKAKPLPSRDGDQRICAWCDMQRRAAREPCVICGQAWQVAGRDRHGRARCRRCPPEQGTDPVLQIAGVLAGLDTGISEADLDAVIRAAVSSPAQQRRLAWALEQDPGLLTGGAARGTPKLLMLIEALLQRGARNVVMPPCPNCRDIAPLSHSRGGQRCCRRCYDRSRTQPCVGCGEHKIVSGRTMDGEPVCTACKRRDPANHDQCTRCGRLALVAARDGGQVLCKRCYKLPSALCSICGRRKPCYFASTSHARCEACSRHLLSTEPCSGCGNTRIVATRLPGRQALCSTCAQKQRKQECISCGTVRPVTGRTPDGGALCRPCYQANPVSFRRCSQCGLVERLHHHGLCRACAGLRQLRDLLSTPDGGMRPEAGQVFDVLAGEDPWTLLTWLRRPSSQGILTGIGQASGPLTHEFLDVLRPRQAVQHLRARLVAAAVLPARDEHLTVLERWLDDTLGKVADSDERAALRRFVTWYHLRRLRTQPGAATYRQVTVVRREIRQAVLLLGWIRSRGHTMATATQADVDTWLASGSTIRHEARNFTTWAASRGYTSGFRVPARPQESLRSTFTAEDERWAIVHRLIHDSGLDPADRAAGLLVLLFAQPLTRITQISINHITEQDGTVTLLLGETPLSLPPPLDALVRELVADRTARQPWLFPGGPAGQHLSDQQLMRRLRRLGIQAKPARNTAMMNLAAELPSIVLSKLLGLHPATASRWAGEAGTPRSAYAAHLARQARAES